MGRLLKRLAGLKSEGMLDPGNALVLIYIALVVAFLVVGSVVGSEATEFIEREEIKPEQARRGELLAIMDDGKLIPAPLLSQKVAMQVSGIVNRVSVQQRFVNIAETWIEAVYVFPLPEESGVDHMRLRVGDRVIEGKIMEKAAAQKVHDTAKREGRKSSLIQQNRPNIFTTKIANIGPGEEVTVEIEYQQTIRYQDGIFSLRFPMVVGPRYIPGKPLQEHVNMNSGGWAAATDQVPDASEITPPVATQGESTIPVELTIDLVAGIPLSRVDSLYHSIAAQKITDDHYGIQFTGDVVADRDFVLEWEPKRSEQAQAGLFSESLGDEQYMLLMIVPPYEKPKDSIVPREVIFILDISGSMAGTSIIQAKSSISLALDSLHPLDSFNLIVFNNKAHSLFGRAKPANEQNIEEAQKYIDSLKADGGTEMMSALKLALDGSHRHERLRQVVFLTDGAVGNEDELLALITKRLGDSRLFTVGIGSAPNGYFMTRAARMGRGTFVYIGKQSEVEAKMVGLLEKLKSPVISDLSVNLNENGKDIEMYPSPLPDLYLGEPIVLAMRTGWVNSAIRLTGLRGNTPWQTIVDTSTHGSRKGIAALWARKKIRNQMESLALGGDADEVRDVVVETALKHHLVSRYTSLVGVDEKISRPGHEKENKAFVKTHLPQGSQSAAIFGGGPQTASPAALRMVLGICFMLSGLIIYLIVKRYGKIGE